MIEPITDFQIILRETDLILAASYLVGPNNRLFLAMFTWKITESKPFMCLRKYTYKSFGSICQLLFWSRFAKKKSSVPPSTISPVISYRRLGLTIQIPTAQNCRLHRKTMTIIYGWILATCTVDCCSETLSTEKFGHVLPQYIHAPLSWIKTPYVKLNDSKIEKIISQQQILHILINMTVQDT